MNKSRRVVGAAIALAAAIAVTGCSKSPNDTAQPVADAQQPAAAAAPEVEGISAPIPQDQVGAQYAVSAEPVLVRNGEILKVVVNVTNTGKVAVNSKGKMPVNLAISLVDGAGAMVKRSSCALRCRRKVSLLADLLTSSPRFRPRPWQATRCASVSYRRRSHGTATTRSSRWTTARLIAAKIRASLPFAAKMESRSLCSDGNAIDASLLRQAWNWNYFVNKRLC
ncbi:hypothetical protein N8D55_19295 [Xanthomonas hortorum pv. pelargonii]|nr:hypothetical protein N8D55_19295 [Xanthomonas hortorum pv. pelargonii]